MNALVRLSVFSVFMHLPDSRLKEILLDGHYIAEEDAIAADRYARQRHTSITDFLYTRGLITEGLLGQAIAEYYQLPFADLHAFPPTREQVLRIPEALARTYRMVLFRDERNKIVVATDELDHQANVKAALKKLFAERPFRSHTRPQANWI